MKKYKKIIITIMFFFFILLSLNNGSNAAQEFSELNNKTFYIKNAYTGKYLDVSGGTGQAGTNVQQYEYNGSDAQKWYILHLGNGEYMLYTFAGSTIEGDTIYLNYALDVDNAIDANGTNIHIWDAVSNGLTQTFSFTKTVNSTYIINTKCSNYSKVASLADNLCDNGINVHQWEYSEHWHDQWILEPVDRQDNMGVSYAKANYNSYVEAYPCFEEPYYDCTNFVSQCLLAGGQLHQDSDWYIERLNTEYPVVSNSTQLDYSWELADPSPWISAKEFKDKFFSDRKVATYTGANIINKISEVWDLNIFTGDVVQVASNIMGIIGDAEHTMYITGTSERYVNGELWPCYTVTYHSNNRLDVNLIDFVSTNTSAGTIYLDKIIIFYDFTQ